MKNEEPFLFRFHSLWWCRWEERYQVWYVPIKRTCFLIYVGERSTSPWDANSLNQAPSVWSLGKEADSREEVVAMYREMLGKLPPEDLEALLAPLKRRDLACWCPQDEPCHADVLLELANR